MEWWWGQGCVSPCYLGGNTAISMSFKVCGNSEDYRTNGLRTAWSGMNIPADVMSYGTSHVPGGIGTNHRYSSSDHRSTKIRPICAQR